MLKVDAAGSRVERRGVSGVEVKAERGADCTE